MIPTIDEGLSLYLEAVRKLPFVSDYDSASREEIVEGNLAYVVSIAKGYAGRIDDLPDLIQEGNIGLIKAVDTRKPEHPFSHWAALNIKSSIRNYLFGSDLFSPKARHGTVKDMPIFYEEETDIINKGVNFEPEKEISMLVESPSLTEIQKEILEARLAGVSLQEIAKAKGVTHQSISQIEQKAIKVLTGAKPQTTKQKPKRKNHVKKTS